MGIRLLDVSYSYSDTKKNQVFAIKNINLNINKKEEFIALVGETGSGKSTLVSIMNALKIPTNGEAFIFGVKLEKSRKRGQNYNKLRKNVGLVFQFPEYQLFEETVIKDVMFAPRNYGYNLIDAKEIAYKTLKEVGLNEDLYERTPFNLSGGEKKLVSIAGILSMEPDILVFDEPTAGLDPETRNDVIDLFNNLNKNEQKSIVLITHDMNIVNSYAKRVIVMSKGEVAFDGKPEELFKKREEEMLYLNLSYPDSISIAKYLNNKLGLSLDENHKDLKSLIGELTNE